jgi:myosin heavy subunit
LHPITNHIGNKKHSTSVYSDTCQPNPSFDKVLPLTVACHFKNSLHELIEKISTCNTYFIRCIKPNSEQKSIFIDSFVTKQLRYCSIMHVCKIRKCGYPYRIKFEDFLAWFSAISKCVLRYGSISTNKEKCIQCLDYVNIKNYKLGKTKVFLRYWHLDILNEQENKFKRKIILIQKVVRGWFVRKRFSKHYQQQSTHFLNRIQERSSSLFEKISNTSQKIQLKKLKKSKKEKKSHNSRFDLNEINMTIKEFDDMLFKYENENLFLPINESPINRNAPFSKSIYNQSKDNTLKQRNALVAFEFKNLLHANTEDKNRKTRLDDNIPSKTRFLSPNPTNNDAEINNSSSQLSTSLVNLNNMNTSQKENNIVSPLSTEVILKQAHFNDNTFSPKKSSSPESTLIKRVRIFVNVFNFKLN